MRINSFVTRRVHVYLHASEQFVMKGRPLLQKEDTERLASIREIEVTAKYDEENPENGLVYHCQVRGKAVRKDGEFGSVDRTFEFSGLDYFPPDIREEIFHLFRRQHILNNLDESYEVARVNGPTGEPVFEVVS